MEADWKDKNEGVRIDEKPEEKTDDRRRDGDGKKGINRKVITSESRCAAFPKRLRPMGRLLRQPAANQITPSSACWTHVGSSGGRTVQGRPKGQQGPGRIPPGAISCDSPPGIDNSSFNLNRPSFRLKLNLFSLNSVLPWSPEKRHHSVAVCQGTSNQMTMLDNHYLKMKKMYSDCNVVLENLEITYIQENQDLSFLQSIQEVGGYVLIAMNEVSTIPLVNLRLIRGQNLYEGNFTLLVMSNYQKNPSSPDVYQVGLKQLQLSNLTEILSGGVKVSHNPLLCNMETINWWDIVDKTSNPTMNLIPHAFERQCQKCDPGCVNGSCWAPGPVTKLLCAEQCSRRCRGPKPIDCCNEHCAGGCTGPRATDCLVRDDFLPQEEELKYLQVLFLFTNEGKWSMRLDWCCVCSEASAVPACCVVPHFFLQACRDFNDDGTCKDTCPPPKIYNRATHQVVDNPNTKYTFGATCVKECPSNYVVTEGACVRSCSAGMLEVDENGKRSCKPCDGICPKVCDGIGIGSLTNTIAVNSTNIGSFRNCTKINGDIILNKNSFEGDPHYKIGPMDPEHLWNLTTVKEITGYLVIMWWPENMTSLSVFQNLEIIRGRTTFSRGFSFVVVQVGHLQWLGLRSLKEVSAGNVILKNTPELRYASTINWRRLFRSEDQSIQYDARRDNQTCNNECSEDGCWGPGPTMCVSCLHVDRGGRCVASCNLLQGEPREAQVDGRCVQCHQECLLQTDSLTCYGPGNLPSPSDRRLFSRLLSSDDDVVDADEYLLPYKRINRQGSETCIPANGHPVRENSIALRYISDPTQNALDKDLDGHEYVNQPGSETSSRLSDIYNPNYEDLTEGWGRVSLSSQEAETNFSRPEYLNTNQNSLPLVSSGSMDDPDDPDYQGGYQAAFPPRTGALTGNGMFLPAAENLEYLGLGAALYTPVR
ncbi:hypothetical protein CCH79_00020389 [Gambusia affinis]|uniref:receptor protein-tyrosine kinase n=1 Tax=Gambusia affinis TaxID=33528 RepID=A0A315W8E8_GAMAF|nr:hypothetical protein CCH79_00020389 [Gambusia affinis]